LLRAGGGGGYINDYLGLFVFSNGGSFKGGWTATATRGIVGRNFGSCHGGKDPEYTGNNGHGTRMLEASVFAGSFSDVTIIVLYGGKDKGTDTGNDTKHGRRHEDAGFDAFTTGKIDNDHGSESKENGKKSRTGNQTHEERRYDQHIRPNGNLGFVVFTEKVE
jgi:hypothetical protein